MKVLQYNADMAPSRPTLGGLHRVFCMHGAAFSPNAGSYLLGLLYRTLNVRLYYIDGSKHLNHPTITVRYLSFVYFFTDTYYDIVLHSTSVREVFCQCFGTLVQ